MSSTSMFGSPRTEEQEEIGSYFDCSAGHGIASFGFWSLFTKNIRNKNVQMRRVLNVFASRSFVDSVIG